MRAQTRVGSLDRYWPVAQKAVLGMVGAMVFSLLMAVGAKLRLPWDPVPFTLQTFFVLLAGAMLGSRCGALSGAWYIALGAGGAPLFAGTTGGWSYLSGVTGGYLFGFAVAAYLVGLGVARLKRPAFWPLVLIMGVGSAAILVCGALWLAVGVGIGPLNALQHGVVPFLPGDALKSLLAAAVSLPILRRRAADAQP